MPNNYLNDKKNQAREQYEKVIEEFKAILKDKTVPENQTNAYKQNIITTLNRLMAVADEMDAHEPGQGVFGLIILAFRAVLSMKDYSAELEVRIRELEREVKRQSKK